MIGIYYGICTSTYFLSSLFETKISNCCKPQLTIILGIVGVSISFILIGPWELVFGHNLIPVVIGLGGLGLSGALMYSNLYLVPTTGLMIRLASTEYGIKYDDLLLDSISALTNFFCNIGEFVGPFVAGLISEEVGFSNAACLAGVISFGFACAYFGIMWYCRNNSVSIVVPVHSTDNNRDEGTHSSKVFIASEI